MDTNHEFFDLASRLRRKRVPLVVVVVVNTCLLVIAPAWRERTTAAVIDSRLNAAGEKLTSPAIGEAPPWPVVVPDAAPAEVAVANQHPASEPPEDAISSEARERFLAELAGRSQDDSDDASDAPPREPAEPSQTDEPAQAAIAAEPPDAPHAAPGATTILNPIENRIAVGYVADGQTHWLLPGERQELTDAGPHTILYHRGGEFGNAQTVIEQGPHQFLATPSGWRLEPIVPR